MQNTQLWLVGATTQINLQDPANSMYLNPTIAGLTGLPDIRTSQGSNVGKDGGWTSAQLFDARLITLQALIANSDVAIVESKRRDLMTLLAEKQLTLKYVSEAGHTYTTKVVVLGAPGVIQQLQTASYFKIDLKADDPLMYDYAGDGGGIIATLLVRTVTGGFEFPILFPFVIDGGDPIIPVSNTGTSSVSPIITLYGPLTNPTIVNQTTNQQMQILASLSGTDSIIVNTALETITMNGLDIYYLLAPGFDFINIDAGDNLLYLTSDNNGDAGYAEVKFNSGYIGI